MLSDTLLGSCSDHVFEAKRKPSKNKTRKEASEKTRDGRTGTNLATIESTVFHFVWIRDPKRDARMINRAESKLPVTHIRARKGFFDLGLGDLFQYRDLFVTFATRDIKVRYKQTALGVAWVVLQPLIMAVVQYFVFTRIANLGTDGVDAFVLSFAGSLGFSAFSQTLSRSSQQFVMNRNLVSKVFFPRLILPLSPVLSGCIDFGVGLVLLIPIMLIKGVVPSAMILTLPLWFGMILLLSIGFGVITSSLMVFYRDITFLIPLLTNLLMFVTPIGYSLSTRGPGEQAIAYLNPLAGLVEGFRWSLLGSTHVNWGAVTYGLVFAVVIFIISLFVFARLEEKFADAI